VSSLPGDGGQTPSWLDWSRALQSVAQAGLTYARDPYDLERYGDVQRVAAEIAATGSAGDVELITGFFASQRGYPTPKVDVRAAVIVEGQILLVRENDDGGWTMPGGWADVGESAAEAAERETREEAGLAVRAVKLIALLDRERRGHPRHPEYSYKVFFACEPVGPGSATPQPASAEISEAGFFARDALPPLSLARMTAAEIDLAFLHRVAPERPTDFD
jgi:ADP-ribose pyrophosphatase YjhB (NUDIX family)